MLSPFIVLLLSVDGGTPAPATSVCLKRARWEAPKGAAVPSAQHPDGEPMGRPARAYFVQLDEGALLDVSGADVRLEGLSASTEHQARIFADKKAIASFRFTFKDGPALALDHNLFYGDQSWFVRKAVRRDCAPPK